MIRRPADYQSLTDLISTGRLQVIRTPPPINEAASVTPPPYEGYSTPSPAVSFASAATPPLNMVTFRPSTPDCPARDHFRNAERRRSVSELSFDDESWATTSILSSRTGSPSIPTWSRHASPLPLRAAFSLLPSKRSRAE